MYLNIIKLRDLHLMSCLISGAADEDNALQFCCHDQRKELSYSENLPVAEFLQRIKVSCWLLYCFNGQWQND